MAATLEDGTQVSRDAEHSTYATAASDTPPGWTGPPPADGVEQTLAPPAGGAAQSTRSKSKAKEE